MTVIATRAKGRRGARGAVFVEATIVISIFVMMFLGVVYFRGLYSEQMRAQRLARAGALAKAMSACEGDASALLGGEAQGLTGNDKQSEGPGDTKYPSVENDDAESKASNLANGSTEGGSAPLMKVTTLTMTGEAKATTKRSVLAKEEGFHGTAGSESFVACADPVNNDQYGGIAGKVTSTFESVLAK